MTRQGTQRASAVEEKTIQVSENATEEEGEEGQVGELKGVGNSREWVHWLGYYGSGWALLERPCS